MGRTKFVGTPLGDASVNNAAVSPQEFGRRLQRILLDRQWSQSDLARAAYGTQVNPKGYKVARNRELISQFVTGRKLPSPLSLEKISRALGVKPEELLPQIKGEAIKNDPNPEMDFRVSTGKSDEGLLRINRVVTIDQFARIIAILQEPTKKHDARR